MDVIQNAGTVLTALGPWALFVMTVLALYFSHKWRDTRDEKEDLEKAAEIVSIRKGYKDAIETLQEVVKQKESLLETMRGEYNEAQERRVSEISNVMKTATEAFTKFGETMGEIKESVKTLEKQTR